MDNGTAIDKGSVSFPSMFFLPKAKKASIDGLKWRDLVVVGW